MSPFVRGLNKKSVATTSITSVTTPILASLNVFFLPCDTRVQHYDMYCKCRHRIGSPRIVHMLIVCNDTRHHWFGVLVTCFRNVSVVRLCTPPVRGVLHHVVSCPCPLLPTVRLPPSSGVCMHVFLFLLVRCSTCYGRRLAQPRQRVMSLSRVSAVLYYHITYYY